MNRPRIHFRNLFLFSMLLILSCILGACFERGKLSNVSSGTESVAFFFYEDYDVAWTELAELIHLLSAGGHSQLLLNDVRINLPPRVPLFDSVSESDRLRIHIGEGEKQLEVQYQFSPDSLDELQKLLDNKPYISIISLSFDSDCSINDVISIMQMLNFSDVPFSLIKPTSED